MDLSSTIHVSDKVQPGHVILASENESIEIEIGGNMETDYIEIHKKLKK